MQARQISPRLAARDRGEVVVPLGREGAVSKSYSRRSQQAKDRRQERDRQKHVTGAWEAGVGTAVNVLIAIAVVIGGARMIPMARTQQRNLSQLRNSVATVEARVEDLQQRVELGLDPLQAEAAMKEYLNYLPPRRMEVRLLPPNISTESMPNEVMP